MSDNEDILGEDLGDHSLADYNLGNEEEEQLLADDYEAGGSQNVPVSAEYREHSTMVSSEYRPHEIDYGVQPMPYVSVSETECVVPNITVEVPNIPPANSTYAPYEPRHYEGEHAVPTPIPAGPVEPPQIVPSEITGTIPNGDGRERFVVERPVGAQRLPQVRDIPDTLDKVVIPRGGGGLAARGRTSWRNPQLARGSHVYRRHNVHRGNFAPRNTFPPPQIIRQTVPQIRQTVPQIRQTVPQIRPEIRQEIIRPEIRPEIIRPDIPPTQIQPEIRPQIVRPEIIRPQIRPEIPRPQIRPEIMRPEMPRPPMGPDIIHERPPFQNFPRYERPVFTPRYPYPRPLGPREMMPGARMEPEVRMLPVVPANLPVPPAALAGKKVLINPHFKGNFQPPVEVPLYIPTRIQKSPPRPVSPTIENKFGPIKDIDDAAERFIAEQRSALARAAARNYTRRSPQRYIENTTIEIENELARRAPAEDELLRRQEEFINANRAGLRRRMRSVSPPRRSPSPPRRSPERRAHKHRDDEESEYRRRVREQESLREHVLRAKEVRRRRNALQGRDRERENREKDLQQQKEKATPPPNDVEPKDKDVAKTTKDSPKDTQSEQTKPDTTRTSPDKDLTPERPPLGNKQDDPKSNVEEVNSTCDGLTPPRAGVSDDELELILGDIDGILSDDDDTGRFKDIPKKEPPKKPVSDLRSKLPAKTSDSKKPRQKIVFSKDDDKNDKSPPVKRPLVSSSTKSDVTEPTVIKKQKITPKNEDKSSFKSRQRIIFENKEKEEQEKNKPEKSSNRRVILQRRNNKDKSVFSRIEVSNDPSKPNPGIFTRAVRTIADTRTVIDTQVEYESGSDEDGNTANMDTGNIASVANLPHGMTDTRLKTLAGNDVQTLQLNKEERTAKIIFKTTIAAENFKKKFNNKMVAASRLSVSLV